MGNRDPAFAPRPPVRLAAVAYLATIVFGVFAEAVVRSSLVVVGDAAATVANIAGAETLYRMSIASDILMLVAYVVVTAIFYALFKPVDRGLSLTAALFSGVGIAVLAANTITLFAPLILQGAGAGALSTALVGLSLEMQSMGYVVSLVFFGVYCLLIGWLIIRSRLVPRAIGGLMVLAGLCYLINSFRIFLAIPLPGLSDYLSLPGLVGEGALSLWLLFRGLNRTVWSRLTPPPA